LTSSTIRTGRSDLKQFGSKKEGVAERRVRRKGGGRKSLAEKNIHLLRASDELVSPTTRGDPMSPLRWTCKSTGVLSEALGEKGLPISHRKVGELLSEMNYSLQSARERMEGSSHEYRDAQFEFIYGKTIEFQRHGQPVISVDARKKELIGQFTNAGKEYHPKGKPTEAETYDLPGLSSGKGIPYGVYDILNNEGRVSVGVDHDTAQFAGSTIHQWWLNMGQKAYPKATGSMITADGGRSNGTRNRLWKRTLQELADKMNLELAVSHFPPGTSKWNKIEHRMFSHITKNWRGGPLTSYEVVGNLIANTRTIRGLRIRSALDDKKYPTGIKVTDMGMNTPDLTEDDFHGQWNYSIKADR